MVHGAPDAFEPLLKGSHDHPQPICRPEIDHGTLGGSGTQDAFRFPGAARCDEIATAVRLLAIPQEDPAPARNCIHAVHLKRSRWFADICLCGKLDYSYPYMTFQSESALNLRLQPTVVLAQQGRKGASNSGPFRMLVTCCLPVP